MHQQIWVGITDTDRVIRYYDMLSDKLRLKHQVISALLAAIACGAAVPLLTRPYPTTWGRHTGLPLPPVVS